MTASTALRSVLALSAVAVAGVLVAAPAAAAPHRTATAPTAILRAAHFSPDTPGVDVYLTAFSGHKQSLWQADIGYGDVGAYRRIPAGAYLVSMRAHGASPSTPAGLTWTLNAKPGAAYTVAAVGTNKNLTGTVLTDSLRAPAKGHGLVRVIQAASRAPAARLIAGKSLLASSARFATATPYATVPAGTWTVTAQAGTLSTSKAITVGAGTVDSVLVLDAKGSGITLRALRDASGTAASPQGAIDTGAGGTAAPAQDDSVAPAWVAGALGTLGLGAVAVLIRRRPRAVATA